MNNKLRKTICILLALLTLVILPSCSDNYGNAETSASVVIITDSSTSEDVSSAEETEINQESWAAGFPDMNYGSKQVIIWGEMGEQSYLHLYFSNNMTGEIVNDAVYERNLMISEKFEVELKYSMTQGWGGYVNGSIMNSVLAGAGEYDIIEGVSVYMTIAIVNGLFTNLYNTDYIDLADKWWIPYVNEEIEVQDKMYMASGYFDMATMPRTHGVFFSTKLADDNGLTDMYGMVERSEWTFDKMLELGALVPSDLNGDNVYNENDQYGITSQWDVIGWYPVAAGYKFTSENENGAKVLSGCNDKLIDINEKLYTLLNSSMYYYSGQSYNKTRNYDNMVDVFAEDRALFMVEYIGYVENAKIRDMGDYGILPIPKYESTQAHYISPSSPFASAITIDVKDSAMSSFILNVLESSSYYFVYPAYFNIALSQKYVNDSKSAEMLNLIYENAGTDFSYVYSYAGWDVQLLYSSAIVPNITTWYKTTQKVYQLKIDNMLEKIKNMEN